MALEPAETAHLMKLPYTPVQHAVLHGEESADLPEALEALQGGEERQDVLISDISMPGVDGYTLMRTIRARSSSDAAIVPAIAVTAYVGPMDRQLALAAGYRLHLSKPVGQDELVAAVAELAGRRPPPRAAKSPTSG